MFENNNGDEIKEKDKEGKGFFGWFFEVFVNKFVVFRICIGWVGLVYNFFCGF